MSMSRIGDSQKRAVAHVALFPSAGIGHLVPFLRLAAMLASPNCQCRVTLIAVQPPVSAAESNELSTFFASHPQINQLDFHLPIPSSPSEFADADKPDPFFARFLAISSSVHLLHPLLASLSTPPLSAIFADFAVAADINRLADELSMPLYIVSTTSARFFSLMACLPDLILESKSSEDSSIQLPGLASVPISSLPPPFFTPDHIFTAHIRLNAQFLSKAKGILLNSFDWFESETIAAVNTGKVLAHLPPFLPIGPYEPCKAVVKAGSYLQWLDGQPNESVVYVSFGSRTALSKEQIRELGNGLERSGCRFLWVIKTTKVDKDEREDLQDLLGSSFLERTKKKGLVCKAWVEQEQVLAHPAIGGFVSHCGWNSVTEAARYGVPILAWPLNGDQKLNAEVTEKAGLGVWMRHWGWLGENLVKGEEIGDQIVELMQDKTLRIKAKKVKEEARKAYEVGGSSKKVLLEIIENH
ncbi:UDP-glycosyltransferase 13-like [Coffea arabica]|uniref:Glycosyltransferase n=1 Tax=Coffea arabica TaxID=13443 RepID=A0A6P6WX39_COFAR|nr:UDP-glycosyltransferase 13-like [Coffea arabica]